MRKLRLPRYQFTAPLVRTGEGGLSIFLLLEEKLEPFCVIIQTDNGSFL
jgi:hypothetical protein